MGSSSILNSYYISFFLYGKLQYKEKTILCLTATIVTIWENMVFLREHLASAKSKRRGITFLY